MQKSVYSIIALLILWTNSLTLSAQKVTLDAAKEKASQFINKSYKKNAARRALRKAPQLVLANDRDEFYVFNDEANGGFVIVSGDEATPEILGYSYDGIFNNDNMPEGLRDLLDNYARQIKYYRDNNIQPYNTATQTGNGKAVEPLIKTKWDQRSPYNDDLPLWNEQKCLTGCVATVFAQILYYYQSAKPTTEIPGYTTSSHQIQMEGLPATTFDWENMLLSYDGSENEEQKAAVAKLMKYCAVSVKADLDTKVTTAFMNPSALKDYFGYGQSIRQIYTDYYEDDEWNEILRYELDNSRPILYSGGGHSFILDGYDEEGRYSFNWGWSGQFDGYFYLNNLNPAHYNFTNGQIAYIGVSPEDVETCLSKRVFVDGIYYGIWEEKGCASVRTYAYCPSHLELLPSVEYNNKTYEVKSIEHDAFSHSFVRSVIIPNTVEKIHQWAFAYCKELEHIDIPNSVTFIDSRSFEGCSKLSTITIPPGLTELSLGMFYYTGLKELFIPKTVNVIKGSFSKCDELVSLKVDEDNPNYDSRNDCNAIIEKASNKLIAGCKTSFVPFGITTIGRAAFGTTVGLKSIEIPNSVTEIEESAFWACCDLESIYLPESLKTIGYYCFKFCDLKDVYCYAKEIPTVQDTSLGDFVKDATLHVPAASLDTYKNTAPWSDFKEIVALPEESTINNIQDRQEKAVSYYKMNGQKSLSPQKGLNITKRGNEKARKIIISK